MRYSSQYSQWVAATLIVLHHPVEQDRQLDVTIDRNKSKLKL